MLTHTGWSCLLRSAHCSPFPTAPSLPSTLGPKLVEERTFLPTRGTGEISVFHPGKPSNFQKMQTVFRTKTAKPYTLKKGTTPRTHCLLPTSPNRSVANTRLPCRDPFKAETTLNKRGKLKAVFHLTRQARTINQTGNEQKQIK